MASRSMPQSCVGQTLHQVPTPSAVLDLAKLEVNCSRMLEAVHRLGLGWRAHIKTHKASRHAMTKAVMFSTPLFLALLTQYAPPDR